jgi:hypothetical protein
MCYVQKYLTMDLLLVTPEEKKIHEYYNVDEK